MRDFYVIFRRSSPIIPIPNHTTIGTIHEHTPNSSFGSILETTNGLLHTLGGAAVNLVHCS